MGGKLSLLQNRTGETVEIRVWIYPARPDRFAKIIRIRPGEWKLLSVKAFNDCQIHGPVDHSSILLMVYVRGVWTGKCILTTHLSEYVKVSCETRVRVSCETSVKGSCETNQDGEVILRGTRLNSDFCKLKLRSLGKLWGCLKSEEQR